MSAKRIKLESEVADEQGDGPEAGQLVRRRQTRRRLTNVFTISNNLPPAGTSQLRQSPLCAKRNALRERMVEIDEIPMRFDLKQFAKSRIRGRSHDFIELVRLCGMPTANGGLKGFWKGTVAGP